MKVDWWQTNGFSSLTLSEKKESGGKDFEIASKEEFLN